jgi:hypothetical protein
VAAEERTRADRGGGAGVPPAADYEAVIVVEGVKQVLSTCLAESLSVSIIPPAASLTPCMSSVLWRPGPEFPQ